MEWVRDLVYEQIERFRLQRLTLDLGGLVLRTDVSVKPSSRATDPTVRSLSRAGFTVSALKSSVNFLRYRLVVLHSHLEGTLGKGVHYEGAGLRV